MRYINGGIPTPRETLEKEHLPHIAAYDDCPYGYLAAYEGGSFVGWFHLRPSVADPSVLELGYRLRHAVWGRGLATEGSRTLLRHAFETLDQLEVDACTDPLNVASSRIMIKCGMKRVESFVHPRRGVQVDRYLVRREEAVLDPPAR
jgi:RimJ/RimL family protein N-acetyltransferase